MPDLLYSGRIPRVNIASYQGRGEANGRAAQDLVEGAYKYFFFGYGYIWVCLKVWYLTFNYLTTNHRDSVGISWGCHDITNHNCHHCFFVCLQIMYTPKMAISMRKFVFDQQI